MRLIDADEVKRAFIGKRYGTKAIEYVIDDAPTVDAVPVIRCKECKHFIIDESKECVLLGCTRYCSYYHDCTVTESDFCSRAEGKTVTMTKGRAKAKNVAEGKKAYTADTSVLKVRKDDDKVEEKEE